MKPDTYGLRALEAEQARVRQAEEGERNDTVFRAGYNIGQLVGGGAIDEAYAEEVLLDAAVATGLGEDEAITTIRSGLERGKDHPRAVRPAIASRQDALGEVARIADIANRAKWSGHEGKRMVKILFACLAVARESGGPSWVSLGTTRVCIAANTKNRGRVQRALRELCDEGWLKLVLPGAPTRSARYTLRVPTHLEEGNDTPSGNPIGTRKDEPPTVQTDQRLTTCNRSFPKPREDQVSGTETDEPLSLNTKRPQRKITNQSNSHDSQVLPTKKTKPSANQENPAIRTAVHHPTAISAVQAPTTSKYQPLPLEQEEVSRTQALTTQPQPVSIRPEYAAALEAALGRPDHDAFRYYALDTMGWRILRYLVEKPGWHTQVGVADALGVARSTVWRWVKPVRALYRHGLIERSPRGGVRFALGLEVADLDRVARVMGTLGDGEAHRGAVRTFFTDQGWLTEDCHWVNATTGEIGSQARWLLPGGAADTNQLMTNTTTRRKDPTHDDDHHLGYRPRPSSYL